MPTCYSKDFNREFGSNFTYFWNNLFRANFKKFFIYSRNYEYDKMYYYFFIIKAKIIYSLIVTIPMYLTVIFGTR